MGWGLEREGMSWGEGEEEGEGEGEAGAGAALLACLRTWRSSLRDGLNDAARKV